MLHHLLRTVLTLTCLLGASACEGKKPPKAAIRITEDSVQNAPKAANGLAAAPSKVARVDPQLAAKGKVFFDRACANCHGPDGSGSQMRKMLPKIGDLSAPETHERVSDTAMEALIRDGRGQMPGFAAIYKPEQIGAIIAYARMLNRAYPNPAAK